MDVFTIKDVENLSGIKAHTIRIWEQRYSLLKPLRSDTNIRYYNNEELKTILNIALLNKYGYKISQIDRMSQVDMNEKILSLSQIEAQQERIINQLIQEMISLDMEAFEDTLDTCIQNRGIQETITQIIFYFLERIGILWHTRSINAAQEHLVINIIRRKLLVGIDAGISTDTSHAVAILFLPEGEYHELGLILVHYLLKIKGIQVLYIGTNIPLVDVAYVADIKKPAFLYTHLTSVSNNFKFDKFLLEIHSLLSQFPIVVSGKITQTYKKGLPNNVYFKNSFQEVLQYISSISAQK